jgi:hypothetical protein
MIGSHPSSNRFHLPDMEYVVVIDHACRKQIFGSADVFRHAYLPLAVTGPLEVGMQKSRREI